MDHDGQIDSLTEQELDQLLEAATAVLDRREELIEYDRPIFESGVSHTHIPHILKGFQTTKLATQDRAIVDADERKEISSHASLVDMEGASVVHACSIFNIRCLV